MNRFSSLTIALCTALVASSACAQDTTTAASAKNNDLRELDVLVVTGATLDGNTQRWADQAGAAAASGENKDVREIDAVIVTGARLDGDTQRWSND
jgi:thiamine pyrophosphate-dependent acetolactate synthase large subunit-like protein